MIVRAFVVVAPVAVLDNDWIFLYNTLNAWGILRDTEDIFS